MKKLIKKFFILVITAAVVWGVTGCGKGSEQQREKREFYYVPAYVDLDLDVTYIQRSLAIGNQLYLIGEKWDDATGESSTTLYCYQLDTGDQSKVDMEMSENSSISQMAANSRGNMVMIVQTYEPVYEEDDVSAGEEDGDVAEDDAAENSVPEESDGATAVISGSSSATFVISESVSETVEVSGDDEVRMPIDYRHELELWEVSPSDGTVLSKADIKPVFDDPDSTWVQYMELDSQDNIYLCCDSSLYLLDTTGQKKGSINFDNWIYNMFMIDGTVYVQYYGETGMETKPVDAQKLALGDAVEIEGDNRMGGTFYQGSDGSVIVHQSDSVYTYDFESGAREELFSWLDADINSDEVENMGQISDGRFWALTRSWMSGNSEYSLAILTKTPAAEVTEKVELVYGTMYLSQDMRTSIIDFNKSNNNYRITVEEYASDDYYSGLTRFNNDLTSGNSPDIIDISSINFSQYASKGVFEDLYPYMERDGIDTEDYLSNVLKAYEVDGKLYGVMPQFYVTTTLAKASNVGDVTGWTMDEMLDFAESHETANLFDYGARSYILYYCVYNNIEEYINWETGKCSFDSEDFIRVLEFVKKFPEEIDYDDRSEGTSARLRSNKVLLMQYSLSSVQEFQMLTGLYGEKVAFVGYPNSERKSNLIQPTSGSAAISSKSRSKDGAWEFVKVFISEDYQNNLVDNHHNWGFPISKDALDKLFEQDMTPEYYEDAEGNKIEQPKTNWGWDDFDMAIYAATPAEIDAVRAVIESADRLAGSINEELTNIITEETEPFFKDQKSAKETADIIQNRIQTYVNENS